MKILFKFASRSRPKKFFSCLNNIISHVASSNFTILASLDADDPSMNDTEVRLKMATYTNLLPVFGTSKNKIDAINRDMNEAGEWDIIINTSDDMVFMMPGFDNEIRKDFLNHYPDLDGVLHYNDNMQRDNCMTMYIAGRKYYDRFRYIYHPSYDSLWSDVESQEVAKHLGKYKYMGDSTVLFHHLHPSFGLAEYDEQYNKTEAFEVRSKDEVTYRTRKANLWQ